MIKPANYLEHPASIDSARREHQHANEIAMSVDMVSSDDTRSCLLHLLAAQLKVVQRFDKV